MSKGSWYAHSIDTEIALDVVAKFDRKGIVLTTSRFHIFRRDLKRPDSTRFHQVLSDAERGERTAPQWHAAQQGNQQSISILDGGVLGDVPLLARLTPSN